MQTFSLSFLLPSAKFSQRPWVQEGSRVKDSADAWDCGLTTFWHSACRSLGHLPDCQKPPRWQRDMISGTLFTSLYFFPSQLPSLFS